MKKAGVFSLPFVSIVMNSGVICSGAEPLSEDAKNELKAKDKKVDSLFEKLKSEISNLNNSFTENDFKDALL